MLPLPSPQIDCAAPAQICQAPLFELLRCHCCVCQRLDRQHPGQGYQLSLLRWVELGLQA
jgi:hypothetical protein